MMNGQIWPRILGLTLIATAVAGAVISQRESRIADLEAAAQDGRTDRLSAQDIEDCRAGCNPRMGLALARLAVSDARLARDTGRRAQQFANAERLLASALTQRPDWPSALIERSYLRTVRDGPGAPAAQDALRESYRAAAFSRTGAPWRVHMASLVWPTLDLPTRTAMLEEALWFSALDAQSRGVVESALGSGEAASAFVVRDQLRYRHADPPDQPEQQ